jgi:hypothetical protein
MGRNVPLRLRIPAEDTEDFPQKIQRLSLEAFMILRQLCLAIVKFCRWTIASEHIAQPSAQSY